MSASTVEKEIKAQFARRFDVTDWPRFKKVGEVQLAEAARLKTSDFDVDESERLLVRNARKRLLIGVGAELILKAVYLKYGYCINKVLIDGHGVVVLKPNRDLADQAIVKEDTFTLGFAIDNVARVIGKNDDSIERGLRIAKVFRNKEGHVVTGRHDFVPQNYRDIEAALVRLYEVSFSEKLVIRFSLEEDEKAIFQIHPLGPARSA